ncbi:Homeobox protein knotted-1-like [Actinidia chinensis var. chinensis]|nr:Homeobox protein knotted-1-like [Actinidia chinensis var. chinensis]
MMTTGEEVALEEDEEMLKKRITGHPLYGLLLHTHLNCLKVGLGDIGEFDITIALDEADNHNKLNATNARSSDLDEFMEFYCMALSKLKEAMEKPLKETETFVDAVHLQLSELSVEKK